MKLCHCQRQFFLLQGDAFAVSVKNKAEVSEIFLSKKVCMCILEL